MGVFHLEGNLAPSVFTPIKVSVLKALASQATMWLDAPEGQGVGPGASTGLGARLHRRTTLLERAAPTSLSLQGSWPGYLYA